MRLMLMIIAVLSLLHLMATGEFGLVQATAIIASSIGTLICCVIERLDKLLEKKEEKNELQKL